MKQKLPPLAIMCLLLLCGGVILSACSVLNQTGTPDQTEATSIVQPPSGIIAEGHIVPREHASLFFTMSGEIIEIFVKEGVLVAKGDVLARLGDRETLEARWSAAQLELITAQLELDDLQMNADLAFSLAWVDLADAEAAYITAEEYLSEIDTQDYQEKIDDARTEVADAQSELEDAQEVYDKYKDLDEDAYNRTHAEDVLEEAQDKYDAAVRKRDRLINTLEQASAAWELASARLEDARRIYEALADGPDADDLTLAQARLDNAQAQITAIEADLKKMDLIAPFDGTIIQIDGSVGERALQNQTVMLIADISEWYIETSDLSEYDVVSISLDQNARVVPDALPEKSLSARVETISQNFIEKSGDIHYKTRLLLQDSEPLLRWGMTVEVHFDPGTP